VKNRIFMPSRKKRLEMALDYLCHGIFRGIVRADI